MWKSLLITQAVLYLLVSFINWDLLWFLSLPSFSAPTRTVLAIEWSGITFLIFILRKVFLSGLNA